MMSHHDAPPKKEKSEYIIQKVIQALNILEQFNDDVDELSLDDLAKRLRINEGSLRMLVATLKGRSYIEENESTHKYRLGFKNLELAQTVLRQTDLYRVSHPILASISAQCQENTAVAVLRKTHVIELDAIQSEQPVQVVSRVGDHLPVHCTAAGKIILASYPQTAVERLVSMMELKRYTSKTITSPEELKLELDEIRAKGYAVDQEELDREVRSVAAAIRDYTGRIVGAVVVTAPLCRMSMERIIAELAGLVQHGAREISYRLGFHGDDIHPGSDLSDLRDGAPGSRTRRRSASPRKTKGEAVAGRPY